VRQVADADLPQEPVVSKQLVLEQDLLDDLLRVADDQRAALAPDRVHHHTAYGGKNSSAACSDVSAAGRPSRTPGRRERVVRAQHRDRARQTDALRADRSGTEHDCGRPHDEVGPMVLADSEHVELDLVGELVLLDRIAKTLPR
jgi:hypothetical protein